MGSAPSHRETTLDCAGTALTRHWFPTMRLRGSGVFSAALAVAAVLVAGAWSVSEALAVPHPVRLERTGWSGYAPGAARGSGSGVTAGDVRTCLIPVDGIRGAVIEFVHMSRGEPGASIGFASAGGAMAWMRMPVSWAAALGVSSGTGSEPPFHRRSLHAVRVCRSVWGRRRSRARMPTPSPTSLVVDGSARSAG